MQLDTFYLFVKELKELKGTGNCTTTESYKVVMGNETIKRGDNSCMWNGFYKLKQSLFGLQ